MTPVLTPSAEHLAIDGVTLTPHPDDGTRVFPDGEVYVDVDVPDDPVIIHSGQPRPDQGLAFLEGVLARCREADETPAVAFTYLPYGRQDATFRPGTLNAARELLTRLVDYHGVEDIVLLDPHCGHRDWIDAFPVRQVHAFPRLVDAADLDDPVVVGPDQGAVDRFGIPGFTKERHGSRDVTVAGDLDVAGRDVIVFDDIIATGGTMAAAYRELQEQGADRIVAAAVHGVIPDGVDRVAETYDALHVTNSIAQDRETVDIGPVITDALNL